ncbi:MAG TPA: S49 family peptidase, partial [Acidobacteriota bacterium]|nr:S49 family peptidase [Acidobacteriota bacterium]
MQNKKKLWLVIAVLLIIVVSAIVLSIGFLYVINQPEPVRAGTVLEVTLSGPVSEFPAQDPWAEMFSSGGLSLWELHSVFRTAAKDESVEGVLLEIFPLGASWAQIEELRDIISEFKDSGKPVWAFLSVDMVTEGQLYLASTADYIATNPTTGLLVNGLMAEVLFKKRTLEKLGIKPQFIQLKEFKSAEEYTRDELTPEVRGMLESILLELQNRFVETVARDRNIESADVQELVNIGLAGSQLAVEMNIIDETAYRYQIQKRISDEVRGGKRYRGISAQDYLESSSFVSGSTAKAHVAVVAANGTIISGKSEAFAGLMGGTTLSAELRKLRENASIDGVILRVDSPGGSPVGSDMIWREVTLLEEEGKPVIVSMSGVAGSGGYYISMGAGRIISQPSTITGSIGVIFGKFDVSGLYEWLGMDLDRIKVAPNADLFSLQSSLTEEQRAQVEDWMNEVYREFVQKAADGRAMEYDELEPKAHGRIYTG